VKNLSALALVVLSGCAAYTPQQPPYADLASATVTGGGALLASGQPVRGGWYPASHLAEGGQPDKGTDGR